MFLKLSNISGCICFLFIIACQPLERVATKKSQVVRIKDLTVHFATKRHDDFLVTKEIILKSNEGTYSFSLDGELALQVNVSKEDLLSPSEEFIVLPLGQFDGFCVLEAQNAVSQMKDAEYYRTVKVVLATNDFSPSLWHDFTGWSGKNSFTFGVGLSGSLEACWYDIKEDTLFSDSSWVVKSFRWIDNAGKTRQIEYVDDALPSD